VIVIAVDAPEVTPDWVHTLKAVADAHPGVEQVMLRMPRAEYASGGEPLLRLNVLCDGCAEFMLALDASLPPSGRVVYD
jgi:hypothetical protein